MPGKVIRARTGRPALGENELVDLTEAAALTSALHLGVLRARRPTLGIRSRPYEVALVQQLFQYLLMYPGLDDYEIGWEVRYNPGGLVDLELRSASKTVLVECKDFDVGDINADARKLRRITATTPHCAKYALAWWRSDVPDDIHAQVQHHYDRANGLDPDLTEIVAHKAFTIYVPGGEHPGFGVALFKVREPPPAP